MATIRRARPKDVPTMVKFGRTFWEQTSYYKDQGIQYDAEHIEKMVRQLIDNGIVQIAVDERKLVGIILMVVGPMPFNPSTLAATELVFYVDEDYRDSGVGKQLLRQAEHIAKQLGVTLVSMIHLDTVSPEKAEAVYDQMGYKRNETVFTKDIR